MEQSPIRLLIVDDSLETCDILENFFALAQHVSVCGVAHDGDEALYRIGQCHPDVVLLDLIMPKADGISVLERIRRLSAADRPRIIVTSAVGQERFTITALSLGADYYMIKPYDLTDLLSRVCMVAAKGAGGETTPQRDAGRRNMEWETAISRSLLQLGIPTHMLGYNYCAAAIGLLLQENKPQAIVKNIYAQVAKTFQTTPECVEGAIRKAIRRAWEKNQAAMRGIADAFADKPPANGTFLTSLTEQIRLTIMDESASR